MISRPSDFPHRSSLTPVPYLVREPLISIVLDKHKLVHQPGEMLRGEYQIDAIDPALIQVTELSVLWHTEGKGEEDLAVHYFERRAADEHGGGGLHELRRFQTELPNSPLSYEGVLVKIRWCVRLRVFLTSGREYIGERSFQVGEVPCAQLPAPAPQPTASV